MEDQQVADLKRQINELKQQISSMPTAKKPEHQEEEINVEEQELVSWEAPVRVSYDWSKRQTTTAMLWMALVLLLLVVIREYILLFCTAILCMVFIAMVKIPPNHTKHKITNKGIHSYGKLYPWSELDSFWVAQKRNEIILYINTNVVYPNRLFFILPSQDSQAVLKVLGQKLRYIDLKKPQNGLDRFSDGRYLPFSDVKNIGTSTFS